MHCRGRAAAPQALADAPILLGATAGTSSRAPASPSGAKLAAVARRFTAPAPPSTTGEVVDVALQLPREFRCYEMLGEPAQQAVASRAKPACGSGVPGLAGHCMPGRASLPDLRPASPAATAAAAAGPGPQQAGPQLAGLELDETQKYRRLRPKSAGVTRRKRELAATVAATPAAKDCQASPPKIVVDRAELEGPTSRMSVVADRAPSRVSVVADKGARRPSLATEQAAAAMKLCIPSEATDAPASAGRKKSPCRASFEDKDREASELGSSREGSTCCSRSPLPSGRNSGRSLKKARSFGSSSSSSSPTSPHLRRPRHTIGPAAAAAAQAKFRTESTLEEERNRARQVYHQLALDGEVSCDDLHQAIRLLGHPCPNQDILDKIDVKRSFGRSFLDRVDFMQFCDSYQALHLQHMKDRFERMDVGSSGAIGVLELCSLLELDGVRPLPSIVGQFIASEFGLRKDWVKVTLPEYLKVYSIVQGRGGIVDADVASLKAAFVYDDQGCTGRRSFAQVHGALSRLSFVVRPDVIKELLKEVSSAPSQSLSEMEWLTFVRKYRDAEVDRMVKALMSRGHQSGDKVYADELSSVLQELGYTCSSPEVVHEVLSSDVMGDFVCEVENLSNRNFGRCSCVFEHLYVLLESLRRSLGFLQAELDELKASYEAYRAAGERAALDPKGSRLVELLSAFQLLGFPSPAWQLQSTLDELGLDSRGRLELGGFLRLAAALRAAELREIQDLLDKGLRKIPGSRVRRTLLAGLDYPALACSSCDTSGGSSGEAPLDVWGAEALVKQHRALASKQLRTNHGFGEDDVSKLRQEFLLWAPSEAASIEPKGVAKLLSKLFPGSTTDKEEHDLAKRLFQEAVADSKGEMRFPEFLLLMRLHRDDQERVRLEKELLGVEASEFSRAETREFRSVFRGGLSQPEGHTMTVTDFVYVVARIVPVMGRTMERELHDLVAGLDADNDGAFGFGEFLLAMKQLVKENWRGINEAASNISGPASEAAAEQRREEEDDDKAGSAEEEGLDP